MSDSGKSPRLHAAQAALIQTYREKLKAGEGRLGWKIGINDPRAQRFYDLQECVVGYMTRASLIEHERKFSLDQRLICEPELALYIQQDVPAGTSMSEAARAIGTVRAAVEVLDLGQGSESLEDVMRHNIFHQGVCIGCDESNEDLSGIAVSIEGSRSMRTGTTTSESLPHLGEIIQLVAKTVASHDEQLRKGDIVISGSMTPAVSLKAGMKFRTSFGKLGAIELKRGTDGTVRVATSGS